MGRLFVMTFSMAFLLDPSLMCTMIPPPSRTPILLRLSKLGGSTNNQWRHTPPSNLDELRGVGSRREAASSKLAVLSDRLIFKIKRLDVIVKRGRVGGILQDVAHLHPFSFGGRPAMNKEQIDGFQA